MNIPQNLKYTQDDEWVRVEGDMAFVGITDYAQHELGDIVFVDVTCEGETIEAGEAFGSVEAVKTVADLLMPVTGSITDGIIAGLFTYIVFSFIDGLVNRKKKDSFDIED